MKIIYATRVPVAQYYDTYFKWHMPIRREICRVEQKISHFLDHHRALFSGKNPNHRSIYNNATLRSGFFPQKMLGDGPAF